MSDSVTINGYNRWEQAFCIYSNIYTREHPHRSSELIQYNHIIHSIASTYTWYNVYGYDKEFRLHLSKHPEHSWAVILQQAWSMRLKDRVNRYNHGGQMAQYTSPGHQMNDNSAAGSSGSNGGKQTKINEPCCHFNRGHCEFGASCCFEHRCSYCFKFGHTILTCHKLVADREKSNKSKDNKKAANNDA